MWQPEVLQANIVQPQDANMMFSGIKQLVFLSEELSLELEQQSKLPPQEQTISACFQKRLPFFRLYIGAAQCQIVKLLIIYRILCQPSKSYQNFTQSKEYFEICTVFSG